ncbi:MAG: hypothetical protein UZ14_CFX002003213 [Chloroflexi bacterium OLB14]|nr:MAG: hypothetical protein UZ14_CFX002003213 [Chloroflexi bacterium OLB14]
MNSLIDHFTKFLSNIQPDGKRVELATDIPDKLREYLKDTDKIKTVDPHTRLSGSYSRYTTIKEIKDVDILLFINEEYKNGEDSVKKVINELVNALGGFPKYLKDESGKVNADLALKRQRRSVQVHITLDEQDFDIDVVPSIVEDGIEKPLLVPDRDLSKWVLSDPLGYSKLLSKINKENVNKVVPLIKMFKHWRDVQMKRKRPKSYWLECMIVKAANEEKLNIKDASWGELFLSLLSFIYNDFHDKWKNSKEVPLIKDPMLANNVAKSWTRDEFESFMKHVEESKRNAEKAINEKDEDESIRLWQSLFNDDDEKEYFPSKIEETLKNALVGGVSFVSSSGKVTSTKPQSEKSWQSPSHRNYGDS